MPRSKRPRKKYRPKVRQQLSGAEVLDDFFFRIEDWGSTDWKAATLMHLVRPFDLILRGEATGADWRQAKTNLIEGYATASQFEECSRIRREIKSGNKLLRVAYNYWMEKQEVLITNVETARDCCQLIIDMWSQMLPGEVTQGCRSLKKDNGKALTFFEAEMEGLPSI